MKLNIIILISTILFVLPGLKGNAQDMIVYDEHKILELKFSFQPYESENSLPNYFITNMAEAQSRMRSYYHYKISTKAKLKLIKKPNNNYQLLINVDSLICDGDFFYKGFYFKKLIIPNSIYFSYGIIEANSQSVITKNIPLTYTQANYILDSTFNDSTAKASFNIVKEKLTFSFSQEQKDSFESALGNINKYYEEGEKLKEINIELNALDINDIDRIMLQNIDIKYIRKKVHKLQMPNFASALSLSETDPAGYYLLYTKITKRTEAIYKLYRNTTSKMDSVYYHSGVQFLADSNELRAVQYFHKSLSVDSNFIPSIYQLALIDFQNNRFLLAEEKLNKLLLLSQNTNHINQLANATYVGMLLRGIEWNNEENYSEGLNILVEAKNFCDNNNAVIICDSKQDSSIKVAQYGMYMSYLSIAGASIQRGRLDMTEDYLNTAYYYQKNNSEAITNTNKVDALYNLLITEYLRLSIESNTAYQNRKANAYWEKADSLSKAHQLDDSKSFVAEVEIKLNKTITSTPSTNTSNQSMSNFRQANTTAKPKSTPKPKQIQESKKPNEIALQNYERHIDKGEIYLNYRRYHLAYPEFSAAKSIAEQFNFKENTELDIMLQQSGRPLIMQNIEDGSLHAWAGRYSTAKLILKSANREIIKLNLQKDSILQLAVSKLEKLLQKQDDDIKVKEFDIAMQKAKSSINLLDFISAETYCKSAIIICQQNPHIDLNKDYPEKLLLKYTDVISYQKLIQQAEEHCSSGEYQASINSFAKADSLYYSTTLKSSSIIAKSLNSLMANCESSGISNAGINYALQQNKPELAFDLWKSAISNNEIINEELSKKCMQELAIYDNDNYPDLNKKSLYLKRFGKNKTFSKYKKYYYSEF